MGQADTRAGQTAAEIELQRKLNGPIDLKLDDTELQKAFEAIAGKAKISLVVDPASYDCLPYGATTKVSTEFRATPVRASIEEVLVHLGLEMAVTGTNVVIRPSEALMRIGRRAEWGELVLLEQLRNTQLPKLDVDWSPDLRTLLVKPELTVKIADMGAHDKAMAVVKGMLPCTVAQALDAYAGASKQVWTVKGGDIVILPAKEWIKRQLERPIVVHFENVPLSKVVAELEFLSRIRFHPAPGLYRDVPMVGYLDSTNGRVQQTLDALAGGTGVAYEVQDDGIALKVAPKGGAATPPSTRDIVGRVAVPLGKDGATFDLFLRESDLSPELNELRKKRIDEVIQAMQAALQTPATQPK